MYYNLQVTLYETDVISSLLSKFEEFVCNQKVRFYLKIAVKLRFSKKGTKPDESPTLESGINVALQLLIF